MARLRRRSSLGDAFTAAFSDSLARFVEAETAMRAGYAPRFVHRARVAVAQMRSQLRAFGSIFEPGATGTLREELRALQKALGTVRDADVVRRRLERSAYKLPAGDADRARDALAPIDGERTRARAELAQALESPPAAALFERLFRFGIHPPVNARGHRRAREAASMVLRRAWRRLRDAAAACGTSPSSRELHRVRIAAKHVRYTAEALAPIAGHRFARCACAAKHLQHVLGEQHDAVVAELRLRETGVVGSAAFVAGELAAREAAAAARARRAWPKAWHATKRAAKRAVRA